MYDDDPTTLPDGVEEPAAKEQPPVPNVDELEDRLRDLQSAMEQLQTGDLDGAEHAIEALEDRIGSRPD
jgi:hypothetical protein